MWHASIGARPKTRGLRGQSAHFRRGAAAVEFAVIAPLFLLLLAGIIEFGQAYRTEHALNSATRLGARRAIVNGSTTQEVSELVTSRIAESLGVPTGDVSVVIAVNGKSQDISKAAQGDEILVSASVPLSKVSAGFYANLLSISDLSSQCTFEHE